MQLIHSAVDTKLILSETDRAGQKLHINDESHYTTLSIGIHCIQCVEFAVRIVA